LIKDFQDILLSTTSKENKELIEIIKTIDQGDNMTFGEKVKRWEEKKRLEGKMEGEIDGKMKVAKNLLKDNVDISVISRITELPLRKIRALQKERA
jgi:hypothetical protein